MKFYCVLQARRREREIWNLQDKKKRKNKESYKCSFFKHFIVVVVIVCLAAHEQSCLAPCRRVARNQFLFEEAHIKHTYIHTHNLFRQDSHLLFFSLSLFCFLSIVTVRYNKTFRWETNKAYFRNNLWNKGWWWWW